MTLGKKQYISGDSQQSLDADYFCFLPFKFLKVVSKIQNVGWLTIIPP